ncbi:MAG: Fic family protein [Proteobacteria bacterium]|nr:Fic family protein [Cystobacterineae bacterium]MCL2259086.1 Fic family protein [Cystobacterineae bacterium]MCL2314355.1 Fic family protein [Pseudomonadota bacterium]
MKELYKEIEQRSEELRQQQERQPEQSRLFTERLRLSWIYHDSAIDGVVYSPAELEAATKTNGASPYEAVMLSAILGIRNHMACIDFIYQETKTTPAKPNASVHLPLIRHIHDLLSGNTPQAQAARIATERRERKERDSSKDKTGFRKDMPLHRTYSHEISQPSKIPSRLEKLVEYAAEREFFDLHPIAQAAQIQFQLIQIFPFTEHSGSVGRMLSNLILLRAGIFPAIVHTTDRQKYYEAFRGTVSNLRGLLVDAIVNGQKSALKFFA